MILPYQHGWDSIRASSPDREAPMTSRGSGARVSKVIRRVFGLADLRPGQQAVIDAVLAKRHTLAIMPTGAGKSLCYQVPAMLMPGMTVMVSPLIALMRDQFEKLSALGLEAVQIERQLAVGPLRIINTGTHRPNLSTPRAARLKRD
jgi:ATP-dependent DNA helicase RecQ